MDGSLEIKPYAVLTSLAERMCGLCKGSGNCSAGCNYGQRRDSVEVCWECSSSSGGGDFCPGSCPSCEGSGKDRRFKFS